MKYNELKKGESITIMINPGWSYRLIKSSKSALLGASSYALLD